MERTNLYQGNIISPGSAALKFLFQELHFVSASWMVFHGFRYLLEGMYHGCMVSSKGFADLLEGHECVMSGRIHCHLARPGRRALSGLRSQFTSGNSEVMFHQ